MGESTAQGSESDSRGKICYLCGHNLVKGRSKVVLDRRPRDVHDGCKKDYEKAQKDLGRSLGR